MVTLKKRKQNRFIDWEKMQGLHEQGGRAVKHASAFPGLATWRKWPWLGQNWKCMESYGIRPWTSYRIASKSTLAAEHSKVHLRYETHQWIKSFFHWPAQAKPSHANDPAAVVPHQDQFDCTSRGHWAMSGDILVVTTRTKRLTSSG